MNTLIKTLHDICVLGDNSTTSLEKTKASYIGHVFINLVCIIAMIDESDDEIRKQILFETYCFNIKRIIDLYKNELLEITNIKILNKIRNTITHQPVNFYVKNGAVYFLGATFENKICHNVNYMDKEGFINISRFASYYLLFLSKEINKLIGKHQFTGLGFNSNLLKRGFDIVSTYEFQLTEEHDEYIEIINKLHESNYYVDSSYLDSCKLWFEEKGISKYCIDYMHILIARSYSIPFSDSESNIKLAISYCQDALNYIDSINDEYNYIFVYKRNIYRNISSYYYTLRNKQECLEYAQRAISVSEQETFVSLKDKILLHSTLSNALSLVDLNLENKQLKFCFDLFEQCEENEIRSISEHQNMIFGNYIDSCLDLKIKLNKKQYDHILSYLSSSINNDYKINISDKLARYYLRQGQPKEAISILEKLLNSNIDKKTKIIIRDQIKSIT